MLRQMTTGDSFPPKIDGSDDIRRVLEMPTGHTHRLKITTL